MAAARLSRSVVLLRGINIAGRNRVPMSELNALAAGLGWRDVKTYVQSGNLVCTAPVPAAAMERELERAIAARFGLNVAVLVRRDRQWAAYVAGNPFPSASGAEPNRVMLVLAKSPVLPDALAGLRARAASHEHVERVGDAIWVHYGAGFAGTRLAPEYMARVVGSPVTTRNWRTVQALERLCAALR